MNPAAETSNCFEVQSNEGNEIRRQKSLAKGEDIEEQQLSKHDRGWRRIVRHFSASWFSVSMGTGIAALDIFFIPYKASWLYWIAIILFSLDVLIFVLMLAITATRYILYPEIWTVMIRHPVFSLFLGCVPIAFTTIIDLWIFICVPVWGEWAVKFAWGLWWTAVVIGVASCFCVPFVIMHIHETELSSMTALWVLPIAPCIVAAATGSSMLEILSDSNEALITLTVSFVLWSFGVPLVSMVLVLYFHRLAFHKLPPREAIVSVFLPLSPLSMGAYGILNLGKMANIVLPKVGKLSPAAGEIFYAIGCAVALLMWSFAIVWLFFAVASIYRTSKFPFNMGWWGFVFPLGVVALQSLTFGTEFDSNFFKIFGTVLTVIIVILWIVVFAGTIKYSIRGTLFFSPCVDDFDKRAKE